MVPENQHASTQSFAICMSSIGFSYLIVLAVTPRIALNSSGERGHLNCSRLEAQTFRLSPSSMKLAEAFV